MKRFLIYISAAAALGVFSLGCVLSLRLLYWTKRVQAEYTLPEGTTVVCVGNSHTGLDLIESTRFANRLYWNSGNPYWMSLVRLREIERLNDLSKIKTVVADLDMAALAFVGEKNTVRVLTHGFPLVWRHWDVVPLPLFKTLYWSFAECGVQWGINERRHPDSEPWTSRAPAWREENTERILQNWKQGEGAINKDHLKAALAEMKCICERHRVRLVMFAGPLVSANPYRNDPRLRAQIDVVKDIVRSMDIEWYDMRDSMPDEAFNDCDHLNTMGAEKFTEKILSVTRTK